jgi:hypothetical protein
MLSVFCILQFVAMLRDMAFATQSDEIIKRIVRVGTTSAFAVLMVNNKQLSC